MTTQLWVGGRTPTQWHPSCYAMKGLEIGKGHKLALMTPTSSWGPQTPTVFLGFTDAPHLPWGP